MNFTRITIHPNPMNGLPSAPSTTQTAPKRKMRWSDTPLYGLWQDREEMADPTAYVRRLRRPRF